MPEFSDERGKHLLSLLKSIVPKDKEVRVDDKKLEEIFTYFEKRKYIHTWEISAWTDGEKYGLGKLDAELLLRKGSAGSKIIEEVIQKSQKRGNAALSVKARSCLKR